MDARFGFIHEQIEIKILILFILMRLPEPVSTDELADIALCDDGISYFDFIEGLSDLVSTEHVEYDGEKYAITEKGIRNGKITETGIPYSVRIKADSRAAQLRGTMNRNSLINTSRTIRRKGGYTVSLSLSDGIDNIISVELLAANNKQAEELEKGFRKNAEKIYSDFIKLILDE